MSDGTHVDAIRSAVAALNRGDIDAYLQLFDPSCPRWVAGFEQPLLLTDIDDNLRQLRAAFDPLRLEEDAVFGADQLVCARWRLRGTHVAEYMGIAATRRAIATQSCEVYEFSGDQVCAVWTYGDHGELFRQIGARSDGGDVQ
jgi:predicted ester cyclase